MNTFLNKATNNNLKLVAYETFIDAENVLQSSGSFVNSFLDQSYTIVTYLENGYKIVYCLKQVVIKEGFK